MAQAPLAEQLRPQRLSQFVGQDEIVGDNGILSKLVAGAKETGFFPSIIFWGPPGSGKTTLARIISNELKREFFEFSAVNTSIKDIETVIKETEEKPTTQLKLSPRPRVKVKRGRKPIILSPIIFIDEIHRFNKAQQDKLLPYIETGDVILVGATTENPSFEVIGPLLSRCRVLVLHKINEDDLRKITDRAIKKLKLNIEKDAKEFLIESSNGDARVTLNVLEIAMNIKPRGKINLETTEQALQRRQFTFDKQGEEFYNVISAYIKSMRASNVDAALYYLARMVEAGQDPLYIARRMVIFASEDIGMAQPTAIVIANEVFKACESTGYPECQISLAHGTVYMASAKKDRSSYDAYFKALGDVKQHGNLSVPKSLRNPVTKLMEDLDYGKGYEIYTDKDLLPEKLKGKKYYNKKNS
ncbi:replication-associated recombination protein A [Patescibacteria group bacterium]